MEISEERVFISGEWEVCGGNRDAYVDTSHAAVGEKFKFARIVSVLGEDDRSVCEGVGVHKGQSFVEIFYSFYECYGSEDFAIADGHPGFYVIQDGGTYKKAFFIARDGDAASV